MDFQSHDRFGEPYEPAPSALAAQPSLQRMVQIGSVLDISGSALPCGLFMRLRQAATPGPSSRRGA